MEMASPIRHAVSGNFWVPGRDKKKEVHMKKRCLIVMAAFALIVGFYGWASAQMGQRSRMR